MGATWAWLDDREPRDARVLARFAVDTLPSGDPGSSFAGRPRREMEVVVAQIDEG